MKKANHYDVHILTVISASETRRQFDHIINFSGAKPSAKKLSEKEREIFAQRKLRPNQKVEILPSSRL